MNFSWISSITQCLTSFASIAVEDCGGGCLSHRGHGHRGYASSSTMIMVQTKFVVANDGADAISGALVKKN